MLKLISSSLILLGGIFLIISMFYIKEGAPVASLNPRVWIKYGFRNQDYLKGPGRAFYRIGLIWFGMGAVGFSAAVFFGL